VKQATDSALGIPSQCFVAKKASIGFPPKGRAQYCANLALKVRRVRLGRVAGPCMSCAAMLVCQSDKGRRMGKKK
jgi:hypothetical protein